MILKELPEDLVLQIVLYLAYGERIELVCANVRFYRQFMKANIRHLFILQPRICKRFLLSQHYRRKLLEKIERPYHQFDLDISHWETVQEINQKVLDDFPTEINHFSCTVAEFLKNFHNRLQQIHILTLYLQLSQQSISSDDPDEYQIVPYNDNEISSVINQISYHSDTYLFIVQGGMHIFELDRNQLSIEEKAYRQMLNKAFYYLSHNHSTLRLKELNLLDGYGVVNLPDLSFLESLSLTGFNRLLTLPLQPFHRLKKLSLVDCSIDNVQGLGNIYDLTLANCLHLLDISPLQCNYRISVLSCWNIASFLNVFRGSRFISLKIHSLQSHLIRMTDWVKATKVSIEYITDNDVLYSPVFMQQCPDHLKSLTLCNLFPQRTTNGFEQLTCLVLTQCANITSLVGFNRIRRIELSFLKKLASLDGLGKGNEVVVVAECHNIMDFSPLRYVPEVKIVDCSGFTNGAHVDHVKHLLVVHSTLRCWISVDLLMLDERTTHLEIYGFTPLLDWNKLAKIHTVELQIDGNFLRSFYWEEIGCEQEKIVLHFDSMDIKEILRNRLRHLISSYHIYEHQYRLTFLRRSSSRL